MIQHAGEIQRHRVADKNWTARDAARAPGESWTAAHNVVVEGEDKGVIASATARAAFDTRRTRDWERNIERCCPMCLARNDRIKLEAFRDGKQVIACTGSAGAGRANRYTRIVSSRNCRPEDEAFRGRERRRSSKRAWGRSGIRSCAAIIDLKKRSPNRVEQGQLCVDGCGVAQWVASRLERSAHPLQP